MRLTSRVLSLGLQRLYTLHAGAGAGALIATSPLGRVQVNAAEIIVSMILNSYSNNNNDDNINLYIHPILDMTGRPQTHHIIIIYFADRPKKEVDANNGWAVSVYNDVKKTKQYY